MTVLNCLDPNERNIARRCLRFLNFLRAPVPLLAAALAVLPARNSLGGDILKVTPHDDGGGAIGISLANNGDAEITASLDVKLTNLNPSSPVPLTVVIPGHKTIEALTLSPANRDFTTHYDYTAHFSIGNCNAVHDDACVYSLPYDRGSVYHVIQGYHGTFSHTGVDEYSIDWKMPVGTRVLAARGGVVVKVKDDSSEGGPDRKLESKANMVLIQHDDGTMGMYGHLQKSGARVKAGDKVSAGDLIGLSGNTGFTSGPHLHFAVFTAQKDGHRVSLPVKFKTSDAVATTLVAGHAYGSTPDRALNIEARNQIRVGVN